MYIYNISLLCFQNSVVLLQYSIVSIRLSYISYIFTLESVYFVVIVHCPNYFLKPAFLIDSFTVQPRGKILVQTCRAAC